MTNSTDARISPSFFSFKAIQRRASICILKKKEEKSVCKSSQWGEGGKKLVNWHAVRCTQDKRCLFQWTVSDWLVSFLCAICTMLFHTLPNGDSIHCSTICHSPNAISSSRVVQLTTLKTCLTQLNGQSDKQIDTTEEYTRVATGAIYWWANWSLSRFNF